ncbi:hypothetical protein [Methylobacterium sp. Leaf466]|uniref:hypothetical protein n=1 Tax=Methylobacterium sp. Leaf466 TaxID=1736386 RepID=UPI0006F1E1F9|nr:hypothetical protein [Methylobacterium sp. Leaf466]KQT84221.1 hypothetical protein ASG59_02110 [Methylobacterium sp. Leaf466]
MPVFDAKNLDSDTEGFALLAAILYPTREAQDRALTHGRCRADRSAALADPLTMEMRFPQRAGQTEAAISTS